LAGERMRKVNEAVREVLSEAVLELKDPRIGFVTITGVRTSERKREKTLAGLAAAHGLLQARIARELRMKRTPTLDFEYDTSVEEGVRMSKLIDDLAARDE